MHNENPSTWSRSTPGGIKYRLLEKSPSGSFELAKGEVVEEWLIQSADLAAAIAEILPGWTAGAYDSGLAYGPIPSLWASRVGFSPFVDGLPADPFNVAGNDPDTYGQYVKLEVTFSTPDNQNGGGEDPDDPDILEVSCNASGEFLILPTGKAYWDTSGGAGDPENEIKQPDIPMTKAVPSVEWKYRFQRRPRSVLLSLLNTARPLLGCVNSGPVSSLMGSVAETVLFMGWSFQTKWTWRDSEPWAEVELNFNEKRIEGTKGHNHFFDPNDGQWKRLLRPNGEPAYQVEDLSGLF